MRNRAFPAVVIGACILLAPAATVAQAPSEGTEIERLKTQLASLQEQMNKLQRAIEAQQKTSGTVTSPPADSKPARSNLVASTSPTLPLSLTSARPLGKLTVPGLSMMQKEGTQEPSPLSFHIGSAFITPVGFMDFTTVNRNTTLGSGIGSNFGAIPYSNTSQGKLSESRFSAQNSRIGLRVDAPVNGATVLGYLEADFLGLVPPNAAVTSNSDTLRLRLYWVDVRKGRFEILGGQSWSMLTPNRKGISALPSDLFYSQVIDVDYMAGLTWSRQPGIRFLLHPSRSVTMGVALENAEQYIGGSGGGSTVVLPAALVTPITGGNQVNNGTTTLSVPNLHPDIIAKIAFDPKTPPGHALHFEVAGLESTFKDYNTLTGTHYTKAGGGVSANLNFELLKNLRLITNNYYSDGGGRYLFGQAPDLVIKGNGDIGLVHASSTVSGFEFTHKNTLLYGYYGGVYIARYSVIDPATGKPVGYGYTGSSASQNRNIQEITFGFNQTFWKDPRYGALTFMGQYAYLSRSPWFVAPDTPEDAHQHQVYFNLRYTLPGSAPTIE
jgi:hypothetical protein